MRDGCSAWRIRRHNVTTQRHKRVTHTNTFSPSAPVLRPCRRPCCHGDGDRGSLSRRRDPRLKEIALFGVSLCTRILSKPPHFTRSGLLLAGGVTRCISVKFSGQTPGADVIPRVHVHVKRHLRCIVADVRTLRFLRPLNESCQVNGRCVVICCAGWKLRRVPIATLRRKRRRCVHEKDAARDASGVTQPSLGSCINCAAVAVIDLHLPLKIKFHTFSLSPNRVNWVSLRCSHSVVWIQGSHWCARVCVCVATIPTFRALSHSHFKKVSPFLFAGKNDSRYRFKGRGSSAGAQ